MAMPTAYRREISSFMMASAISVMGEPIDPQDTRFGTNTHQKAKNMAAFFRENFKQIRLKNEDARYFKKKLFLNYRYHEGDILHQVKVDFKKHKDTYYQLFKRISDKAKIAHISGDYGQVDFLLVHQFPTRKISSYLPEEAHADIARSSYITQKFQLSYVQDPAELWPKKRYPHPFSLGRFQRCNTCTYPGNRCSLL